jgi:endonuclease YncB( thermonuclease family)
MRRIFIGAIAILASTLVIAAVFILVSTGGEPEAPETPASEPPYSKPPHYEVVASAVWVVDGDTIDVKVEELTAELDPEGGISENTIETIRFGGGIDAPETWTIPPEEGGLEATEFIENFLPVWTTVYLDIDNLAESSGHPYRDVYGRLIAVIYVELDGRWVNVNAELLCWGMEAYPNNVWDEYTYFTSEFSVYDWPPYDNDYPYALKYVERRNVTVLILPDENTGAPGENATFTVFIKNIGNVEATYSLIAGDNTGWNLMLTDDLIEHIAPNNVKTITLAVTIPDGAENCTRDNITVTARSQENAAFENSASCIAHCLVGVPPSP